jgi:hypothetical protein
MRMGSVVFEPLISLASWVLTGPGNVLSIIGRDQITFGILSIKCLGIKLLGISLWSINSLGVLYTKQSSFFLGSLGLR